MGAFGLRLPPPGPLGVCPPVRRFSAAVTESAFNPQATLASALAKKKKKSDQGTNKSKLFVAGNLMDFATPRGFGDSLWAGTVSNENKGRGGG